MKWRSTIHGDEAGMANMAFKYLSYLGRDIHIFSVQWPMIYY